MAPDNQESEKASARRLSKIGAESEGHLGYNFDNRMVSEPLARVPVPSRRWVIIVSSNGVRYAAVELPRSAFTDPVLIRTLNDMDEEMNKHED